jgi:hypothetical protein
MPFSRQRHLVADPSGGGMVGYALARQRRDPSRPASASPRAVRVDHRLFARPACSTRPAFSSRLSDDTVELRGQPFIRMISVERPFVGAHQRQDRFIMLGGGLASPCAPRALGPEAVRAHLPRRSWRRPCSGRPFAFASFEAPSLPPSALIVHEVRSGNEPATITAAASAAEASDLRRATTPKRKRIRHG